MPLDFPSSPTNGQIYDNYYWDESTGVWNSLGNYAIPNLLSNGTFTSSGSSVVPLTVKGALSQAANLQEWKNNSDTTLASISASGGLSLNNALTVLNGGTGASTLASGGYLKGAGTGAITSQAGIPAGDITSGTINALRLPPGTVVGFNTKRTTARTAYGYNADTIISDLNISITPKYSNSLLLVQWNVVYESDYNAVFRIFRDGGLIYTSGYQGYNENDGNQWSGVAALQYDTDVATTPNSQLIQYFVPSGSTAATTLQLAVRTSYSTANTFYLNRPVSSAGASANEIGVSTAVIWEIAQ